MTTILTILAAIIIFAVLIFVHELGHFVAAKLSDIKVHEFAIGMGPKLFSFGKGETKYSLRLLPIGGYCALEGENSASSDERAFINKSPLKRLVVLAAGAFMNILLGFVLLVIVNAAMPQIPSTQIAEVTENSAAQSAGIKEGDIILEVNSANTPIYKSLRWELSDTDGSKTNFTIKRNGKKINISVAPEFKDGAYMFGIGFAPMDNNMLLTLKQSFHETVFYSRVIIETFLDLLRGRLGVEQMSGPIGIVSEIGGAVEQAAQTGYVGFMNLLLLAVLLTVNLGVFNLLPLPALDGGRILFVLIELIRRKPLPPEKEGLVHTIGLIALLLLSVFIAYMDITKFF